MKENISVLICLDLGCTSVSAFAFNDVDTALNDSVKLLSEYGVINGYNDNIFRASPILSSSPGAYCFCFP